MQVCALSTRQMFTLPLVQADILKPEDNNFDYLSHPFHAGPITGLDTCVRKQMIATCSTDMSVRIWNTKEMGCDLAKYFDDEAYSVSLHPSGLHVLVGFADKVRPDMFVIFVLISRERERGLGQSTDCSR